MGLNVIIASPEAKPFSKTGGLADVAGSLPLALKDLGVNVSIFLPLHRATREGGFALESTGVRVTVPVGRRAIKAEVMKSAGPASGVSAYFLKCDEYFDRTYLYGTPEGDYFDNLERYAFFSRGVIEGAKALHMKPDIFHANDWQTGLIPAYLKDAYGADKYFSRTATLFTIHNIAYQGLFDPALFEAIGLKGSMMTHLGLEFWGKINLLKAGVVYSDVITTVSRGYSLEIQTPEYGYGLEGVLGERKEDLYGVLNGVDYGEWDPATDTLIPERYSTDDLSGKAVCKEALIKEFGLGIRPSAPVIGMISRLADQKGFDILLDAMPGLMDMDVGMIILGQGDKRHEDLVLKQKNRYPKKLSVRIAFDNRLAHLVEAGSDIFLMPSRYEPCGLNQIYSLKYGTVPVVRATGGLDDTIRDYKDKEGNGFKFKEYSGDAIVEKVREATALFEDKKSWQALQKRVMREDFSWEAPAKRYLELYRLAMKKRAHKEKPGH